jgi:hypothetical protein
MERLGRPKALHVSTIIQQIIDLDYVVFIQTIILKSYINLSRFS